MPTLDVKLLVLVSPLVNVDIFKKGLYQVRCRVKDVQQKNGPFGTPYVSLCQILDSPNGVGLRGAYPRAYVLDDNSAVTKTVFIQYIQQNYVLSDWFAFDVSIPVLEIPDVGSQSLTSLELALDLYLCEKEKTFNVSPEDFVSVSSRTVVVSLNWYGGLHEYTDAIFDFVYMAAVGVNVHAAVVGVDTSDVHLPRPAPQPQPTSWFGNIFKSHSPSEPPPALSFSQLLFSAAGQKEPSAGSTMRSSVYKVVPTFKLVRACKRFEWIWTILRQSYMSLQELLQDIIAYRTGDKKTRSFASCSEDFPIRESLAGFTTIEDFTLCCERQLQKACEVIRHTWMKFSVERLMNQGLLESFIYVSHRKRISSMLNTTVLLLPTSVEDNKVDLSLQARKTRDSLDMNFSLWCKENTEEISKASVVFVEHLNWKRNGLGKPTKSHLLDEALCSDKEDSQTEIVNPFTGILSDTIPSKDSVREEGQLVDDDTQSPGRCISLPSLTSPDHLSFSDCTYPYLLCSVTGASGKEPSSDVHLVVFLHGLEGRHFDLRLYKIYLELSLPQVTFDFLLCKSMEGATFCDFNQMTDHAVDEFLKHIQGSVLQPTRISFVAHSLGSIVVRNMLTRPEMAPYLPKMHTMISLCAPHLGTTNTSSHISLGMWFLQKWHHSQSLLQLSLKDSTSPRETFLYRLSQKITFGRFNNVLLVASPQDKYVPFHSARLELPTENNNHVYSEMLSNIMESLRQCKTNVLRFTVEHLLDSSTNSLIGRAAHIAKLEDVKFVEKFVVLHCTKYFV